MSEYGMQTYPPFNLEWSDGALPAILLRIKFYDDQAQQALTPETRDSGYGMRNDLIWWALVLARQAGYEVGVRIDPDEPEWPVFYIELPTGQVSWHLPQHRLPYDGHTTEEKYDRSGTFAQSQLDAIKPAQPPLPDAMLYGSSTYPTPEGPG
jgi:hypothetical protein